jgi:hypothetical protein
VDGFAARHGGVAVAPGPGTTPDPAGPDGPGEGPGAGISADGSEIVFLGTDGAVALCQVPFPPLAAALEAGAGEDLARRAGELIAEHALADRTVAVLLVRLGGYAAGVFTGPGPRLAGSKVGARLVHGRSAAGGTSQHRFARRREKQAAEALGAAADTAAAVFGPFAGRIDAVVLGGDRRPPAAPLLRAGRGPLPDGPRSPSHGAARLAPPVPGRPHPPHRPRVTHPCSYRCHIA